MGVLESTKISKNKEENPLNSSIDKTSALYVVEVILKPAKNRHRWMNPILNSINNVQLFPILLSLELLSKYSCLA